MVRADQPYYLHVPIVWTSGSLTLLEPSGSVQACNGIALPLPLLDGWLSTSRPGSFTPGKDPVPIVQGAVWATGPVWTGANRCTNWALTAHCHNKIILIKLSVISDFYRLTFLLALPSLSRLIAWIVLSSWNVMVHGDAREGKQRRNWRLEYPVLSTLPRNMVYPALLPLMRTPRLLVVDWIVAPTDLNGLVLFAERRNLVSARVPSHFKRSL